MKSAVPVFLFVLFLVLLIMYFSGVRQLFIITIISGIFAAISLLFLIYEE